MHSFVVSCWNLNKLSSWYFKQFLHKNNLRILKLLGLIESCYYISSIILNSFCKLLPKTYQRFLGWIICIFSIVRVFSSWTLKKLGVSLTDPLCGFSKIVFSIEWVKSCFLATFNSIISHIFSENLIEIHHVVQKIWKFYSSILGIFINFLELTTSAYIIWYQHFLSSTHSK